ncbi:flavoprotein [Lentzea aerocolonigenes]|uniref:flavoprotein n=1 Tax=Lentzea aerocolonigenes TaxID=68170 RepID=UPI0009DCF853|nr:flavoprotein [Lentzea aerocolonigenes]
MVGLIVTLVTIAKILVWNWNKWWCSPGPRNSDEAGQPALPKATAVVVAPATYNTINKWAAGIADTCLLTQLAELTGLGVPLAVLPFVNTALANNRPFRRSVDELRESDVTVLFGEGGFVPHPPRTDGQAMDSCPWGAALSAVKSFSTGAD